MPIVEYEKHFQHSTRHPSDAMVEFFQEFFYLQIGPSSVEKLRLYDIRSVRLIFLNISITIIIEVEETIKV